MHIGDTPEEAAFRTEAHAWLKTHAHRRDSHEGKTADHTRDLARHMQECRDWQRVLYDNNWAGITWPKQYGGRGASAIQSAIFAEEMSQFDVATGAFAVSIGMVGPTLIAHGTPEQQQHHLAPILKGEEVWCQLFSEPGSGSDLASLGTRAVRDGDWKLCLSPGSGAPDEWLIEPLSEPSWKAAVAAFGRNPTREDLKAAPFVQLFNLADDPHEDRNLAASHHDRVAAMVALLERSIDGGRSTPGPPLKNDKKVVIHQRLPDFIRAVVK